MTEVQKRNIKWIGSGLGIAFSIVVFMWRWDTVYARDAKVDTNQVLIEKRVSAVEAQTVQTFEMVQKQIDTSVKEMSRNNQLTNLNMRLNYLTEHKYGLRASLRKYPDDKEISDELAEVEREISSVKALLNKLLMGN